MQRYRPSAKPLADLVADALSPALAAKGFAGREVIARWGEIAGTRLAARSRPMKIEWPRKRPEAAGEAHEAATLVVLAESAFAPELQHAAPLIMGRINAHLGWPAVGRIVLKQGPVGAPAARPAPAAPLAPETINRIARSAGPIHDDGVREAMVRLGLAVAARRHKPG
jgi:hypothetical protein